MELYIHIDNLAIQTVDTSLRDLGALDRGEKQQYKFSDADETFSARSFDTLSKYWQCGDSYSQVIKLICYLNSAQKIFLSRIYFTTFFPEQTVSLSLAKIYYPLINLACRYNGTNSRYASRHFILEDRERWETEQRIFFHSQFDSEIHHIKKLITPFVKEIRSDSFDEFILGFYLKNEIPAQKHETAEVANRYFFTNDPYLLNHPSFRSLFTMIDARKPEGWAYVFRLTEHTFTDGAAQKKLQGTEV